MNRCKDCGFWQETKSCGRTVMECTSDKIYEGSDTPGEDELVYPYYEGGRFYPGPEFGCVNWKKRED